MPVRKISSTGPGRAPARWAVLPFVAVLLLTGFCSSGSPAADSLPGIKRLGVAAFVSWWSLDPTGYSPCILVKVENRSGRDLSGTPIRFQGRFVDMRDGIVTVARKEMRQRFLPHQQMYVLLCAPQDFDLPIDVDHWPPIECKIMCRVGDVGDEGTQDLLVTRIESVTMTNDDAYHKMSRIVDYSQVGAPSPPPRAAAGQTAPARPLAATPGSLSTAARSPQPGSPQHPDVLSFLSGADVPGVGDDFYRFERVFGLPAATDAKRPDWTWVEFKKGSPSLTVLAGSRGATGKVDVLIVEIPAGDIRSEQVVQELGRSLAGKLKSQKLGAPARSVRYLPAGRTQVVTLPAPGYQLTYLPPRGPAKEQNTYIVIVSRPAGPVEKLLSEQSKKTRILRPIAAFFPAG